MRQVNIALGLIKQGDNYLLQFRNGDPKIGAAGLIGCFGGKIADDEKPKKAVWREIKEETSLRPKQSDFNFLGIVKVESDHQLEPVKVHARAYEITTAQDTAIKALEGELITMTKQEILQRKAELTPATRALFEEIFQWL
jgi:ADP-ribose pyrophosphatase YjhB (NUDIX family)